MISKLKQTAKKEYHFCCYCGSRLNVYKERTTTKETICCEKCGRALKFSKE